MGTRRGAILSAEANHIMTRDANKHKLTLAALATAKRLPVEFLRGLGLED
ncbi:MAG: hypothetical protein L0Z62_27920 [Gemmataceae bacterium]|nr:hypothetical protein [Gemmataceae bacterium]